jgi:hypothetical protein
MYSPKRTNFLKSKQTLISSEKLGFVRYKQPMFINLMHYTLLNTNIK